MPKFEYEEEINAPDETVWAIVSNPNTWPQWFPEIESVSNFTGMQQGGTFEYQHNGMTGHGQITALRAGGETKELEVVTEVNKNRSVNWFRVGPKGGLLGGGGGKSWLNYHMEYNSAVPIVGSFITGGNPMDQKRMRNAVDKVKQLAESGYVG